MTQWRALLSARLVRLEPGPTSSYSIETERTTIGRSPQCQIVLSSATVSRRHASIERAGTQFNLVDLNSANGTFVNGRRLSEPHPLIDGDLIGLGGAAPDLRFELLCSPTHYD